MASSLTDGDEPEFQIAPLIDVLLVLLIFFMSITTMQVDRVDKEIDLPGASEASRRDSNESEIVINVRWDPTARVATYTYEQRLYPQLDRLLPVLRTRMQRTPGTRILIRGARQVPAEYVGEVLRLVGALGVGQVNFATLLE